MKTSMLSVLTTFTFLCFAPEPKVQAVSPVPDGCYPQFTTAEGCNALNLLTTGVANTGVGWRSLFANTGGNYNTGLGAGTLVLNNADSNTAVGTVALFLNTSGHDNTANGIGALLHNNSGNYNSALGGDALFYNFSAHDNTAVGDLALFLNDISQAGTANFNTAVGSLALASNTDGLENTAVGFQALYNNAAGHANTAVGEGALADSTGDFNTAVGDGAGFNLTTGSGNVYIGTGVGGLDGESNITRIANIAATPQGNGVFVTVESGGNKLGFQVSSGRYKEQIKPMEQASESLYRLAPVTFRYKKELDPQGTRQYGLIAEEVAKVEPDLVVNDEEGKPATLRFLSIQAMLLNEFLKEHKAFVEEQHKVEKLETTVATLMATVKEQVAQIQKINAHLESDRRAMEVVSNDR
jgi:Chaperone of endosialidase